MKHLYISVLLFFLALNLYAQADRETIDSDKLSEARELKIQLPRNYDPKADRVYPLVVVLDGDYLFEPVAGNIDYQAYWEGIPDCIVVGVNQEATREDDMSYDMDTSELNPESENFYAFLKEELLPYIEQNYKVSSFRMIVGHELSANYVNYFLLKKQSFFRAYVSLSPDLAPNMKDELPKHLSELQEETFYYMATADTDFKSLRATITECDSKLKTVENAKLKYEFNNFNDTNHYSLVGMGIPKALNKIFTLYKPITRKEYKEKVLTYEGSPYDYLIKKYEDIAYFYGFEKKVIENDIRAIAAAAKKRDDIDALGQLADLVKVEFPKSMMKSYYMGIYHEKAGDLKKALLSYKSGLMLEPSQYVDKELILDKMYQVQNALKN
jgi:predicted alpha/beta superfamily hydrolase